MKAPSIFRGMLYALSAVSACCVLYLGSYYVLYHINGSWMTYKYNRYYFDGDKNYHSTGWRYSRLYDHYYAIMEYVEPLFQPCLIQEEIYFAEPCTAEQKAEVKRWRAIYPTSLQTDESGFVYNSYGRVYMNIITFWGQTEKVPAAKPNAIW